MALTGTEILQVQGVDLAGHPAATTEQTTTQAIANLAPGALSTLASANLFVGSAGNLATARAITGDIAISNTGIVTAQGVAGAVVITTAKLTALGAAGSMTFTNGLLTAHTDAT
jgi:hypothetical protein